MAKNWSENQIKGFPHCFSWIVKRYLSRSSSELSYKHVFSPELRVE